MSVFAVDNSNSTQTIASLIGSSWPIFLVVLLGGISIFLILPRPKRLSPALGGLLGTIALIIAGWFLIKSEVIWEETLLFYAFSAIAIFSGGLMIMQSRPVRAALSFAVVVLSTCGLFLLQAAPFLMAATIIVYAGAIVVTFLFVIMLAQQSGFSSADVRSREPFLATLAGFVLLAAILLVLNQSFSQGESLEKAHKLGDRLELIFAAKKAKSLAEIQKVIPDDFFNEFIKDIEPGEGDKDRTKTYKNQLKDSLVEADVSYALCEMEPKENETKLKKNLEDVYQKGMRLRYALLGTLQADPKMALSPYSGIPPNKSPVPDPNGRAKMPAENVKAIGRSLFTDYLIPVELAATLLLVATIGAIAIAGRRTKELR